MSQKKEKIYLIDGNSLCYRAFYAIQELTTSKGMPTNAIYGVINMLRKIIKEYDPDMVAVAFDMKGPAVRHEKYEDYKIQRKPMPDDLVAQFPRIKEVIDAYNIPIYELKGYEADDIIATLAEKAKEEGIDVVIVTGDKDALQLVDDRIKVLSPHMKESKLYDRKEVEKKFGVSPKKMIELMAFMGDTSDNVRGVAGVGQVTAKKLIEEYGSVEGVYNKIDGISSKSLKEKLLNGKDDAELSRELVTLVKDLPIELDVEEVRLKEPDSERLAALFEEFEFHKLLRELAPRKAEEVKCSVLSSEEDIKKIIGKKVVAFSVAKDAERGGIEGISFSWKEGESCYVPLNDEKSWETVKDIFEEKKSVMVGYDIKDLIPIFREHGISLEKNGFDAMIADYLIEPSRSGHDLDDMAVQRLGYNISGGKGAASWDEKGQGELDFSGPGASDSSCAESNALFKLYPLLKSDLEERHLTELFRDVEMPLISVLAGMEREGVGIDTKYMEKTSKKLEKKLKETEKKIYVLAGEEFNINSPKQLQVILFEKLELPPLKKTKTGSSTDESVLSRLAAMHELPAVLLEYRALSKLKTTYYDSILSLTDNKTKKLHTHFNQAVTSTGRLSSSEPNLQNIPIKTEMGKEIRRAFIPGEKKHLLLAADYSQIELRILAHLSKDKNLLKAFKKGVDVHILTASLIFDTSISEVTDRMRSMAKTVNFGIIYGMSAFGLARDLGISQAEAQEFIDSYFERYSGVSDFVDKTIEAARKKGYVTTLLKRRRYIPELSSPNMQVRGFAERAAINTPVQGSAADLIKLAMLKCDDEFNGTDVRMILQVHDELIFTVPEGKIRSAASKVRSIMEGVMELKVPLTVNVKAGANWFDLEEVDL